MKKKIINKSAFKAVLLMGTLLFSNGMNAQVTDPSNDNPNYDNQKKSLISNAKEIQNFKVNPALKPKLDQKTRNQAIIKSNSSCFIPIDNSFTAIPRNDDGSFGPLALPFTFDLYGTSYNQVWINTNGNLTFTQPYAPFSASGFPFSVPMVAPFWGDVDTRNTGGGQIHYKLSATNLIVVWDGVGHYNQAVDKLNTFQAVISDGLDPIAGIGQNVCFNYGDMQWTTGSASNGINGFGGVPATVGANKGNNVDFFQIGRFNLNSTSYDGPGLNNDGINYLDNQCLCSQTSSQQNVNPIASNFPTDTVTIPCGDTFSLDFSFIPPEVNQSISTTVNTNGTCGTTFTSTSGAISNINFTLLGQTCNEGLNTITFTGTDNGAPNESTTVTLNVIVESCCDITSSVNSTDESCANSTDASITVSTTGGTAPIEYSIDGGSTYAFSSTINGLAVGVYSVLARDANGCETSIETITIEGPSQLVAAASASQILCNGQSSDINVTATGGTAPYTGNVTHTESAGTYTYTVTDANGCSSDVTITVTEPTELVATASASQILCNGQSSDINVTATGGTAPYTGNGTYTESAGTYTYTVTDANGCSSDVTITVAEPTLLIASASASQILCNDQSSDVNVTATGGTAPYTGNVTYTESAGTYTYTVTDANGCSSDVTITVTEPAQIEANITPQNHIIDCVPIPVTLTATPTGGTGGPYTYLWSTGETTASVEVNPNETTSYSVEVTDANGCTVNLSANETTITVTDRCGNNNQKVIICHVPHGNNGNPQTICISPNALSPHLSDLWNLHGGDYCGPCISSTHSMVVLDESDKGNNSFIKAGLNRVEQSVELSYRLKYDSKVRLEIYNMSGTLMEVIDGGLAEDGQLYNQNLVTDKFSNGVYIYKFITDKETHIDKLQIIE